MSVLFSVNDARVEMSDNQGPASNPPFTIGEKIEGFHILLVSHFEFCLEIFLYIFITISKCNTQETRSLRRPLFIDL